MKVLKVPLSKSNFHYLIICPCLVILCPILIWISFYHKLFSSSIWCQIILQQFNLVVLSSSRVMTHLQTVNFNICVRLMKFTCTIRVLVYFLELNLNLTQDGCQFLQRKECPNFVLKKFIYPLFVLCVVFPNVSSL